MGTRVGTDNSLAPAKNRNPFPLLSSHCCAHPVQWGCPGSHVKVIRCRQGGVRCRTQPNGSGCLRAVLINSSRFCIFTLSESP